MDGGPINEKVKKEKKVTINGYVTSCMGQTKKEIWSISMGRREYKINELLVFFLMLIFYVYVMSAFSRDRKHN